MNNADRAYVVIPDGNVPIIVWPILAFERIFYVAQVDRYEVAQVRVGHQYPFMLVLEAKRVPNLVSYSARQSAGREQNQLSGR